MEKIINLNDLLKHEILDLYSAEEQIIDALPAMISKAGKPELRQALSDHLTVSKIHKQRLDTIKTAIQAVEIEDDGGFFLGIFGHSHNVASKGIEALIKQAEKIMEADISPEALDAAIIASAQKIEHYEIAGYGTARAWALELKLDAVVADLETTLKEEYEANDSLTKMAVGQVNASAENAIDSKNSQPSALDQDFDRLQDSVSIMSSSHEDRY